MDEILETRFAIVSTVEKQFGPRCFMCPVRGFGVDEFMEGGNIERAHLYKTEAGAKRWIAGRGVDSDGVVRLAVVPVVVAIRRGKVSHVVEVKG